MANERNKILPYALSAIEGVNIQSQEDYSASSETTGGVSTGLANGNNFNKLAKQVSIMSSSLAEFIVNTLSEQTISDTNSIEEISSALNNAILKLIKDNEPVIPDQSGIKVIDDNNTDITSFNQIKEDGIYYIYKQLSDGPSQNGEAIKYNFIYLIVINVSIAAQNVDLRLQMTSFGVHPNYFLPGNIGSMPMIRTYNTNSKQWEGWAHNYGIPFVNNNIVISDFTPDKSRISFPIIAIDDTFPNKFNTFMYSATKAQMREKLGIADSPDLTDYFNKKTDKIDLASQVTGQLKNSNISDNAITTSKITSLAITEDKLVPSSVTNNKIANGAVTSEKIASKTITASNIADNTITSQQIAENAITASELANNAVDNAAIANGAVTDAKFSGILSIAHGGHGGTNINEARDNLEVLRYKYNESNKNFTNAPTGFATYYEAEDIPSNENLSCFSFTMYHSGTPVNGYAVQYYIGADGFTLYGRVRVGTESGYRAWKKLRNIDGSIPAELISPTVLKYENSDGVWTETKLTTGEVMLEGWGTISSNVNNRWDIYFPKDIKKGAVQATKFNGSTEFTVGASIIGDRLFFRAFSLTGSDYSKIYCNWYFRGILA